MKFQRREEFENWVLGMLEKCEVDESELENYEPTEEEVEEAKAFKEVMGQMIAHIETKYSFDDVGNLEYKMYVLTLRDY